MILAVLLMLATTSCELGASSYQLSLGAAPAAASAIRIERPAMTAQPIARVCGYAFESATAAEAEDFLVEARGVWRDHLASAMLAERPTMNAVKQGGIEISEAGVAPVSVLISPSEADGSFTESADGYAVTGTEREREPRSLSIGPLLEDGFRLVQLNYVPHGESPSSEADCEAYAFKSERLSDGRAALLVRGPVSPHGAQAADLTAFELSTRNAVRVFVR
jgi:hypothetical protein